MNEELKIIIKAVTDSAKKAIGEVNSELEKLGGSAKSSSGKMGAAFKTMAKGAAIAVAAIVAIGAAIVKLGKSSLDLQKNFAKLNTAFQAAGMSAQQAGETYNGLYRFLGESDRAVEAANHLAKLTNNQKNLAEWSKIAQGIYASFGDSLPIESIAEAANETARVGKVVGTMADALNWMGESESAMNDKLAQTSSLEEREALLRSTLNGLYSNAAEIYERNNQALLSYNESQAKLDSAMSAAGAATMPLLTALNNLGTAFFSALKPALDAIIPPIATFINWIAKAIQSVLSFFSALTGKSTAVKAVGDIGKGIANAAGGANNLASGMEGAGKAAEEAKKSTQGFDELNIVSSGSSGGSGGSGGGGGSGSPAYSGGLIDNATFGTEVEEAEGTANSFVDRIKETFSKLADVFAPSIEAWSGAFETVKQSWNNAKPDFINGALEIKDSLVTLGTYLGSDFVPTVVNSFSTNLAPVIGDTLGFLIEEYGKQFSWIGTQINIQTNDIAIPVLERLKTVATDVFSIIGSKWEEYGTPLLDNLSQAFENIRGHFENFYNNVFKPIWDKLLEAFDFIWVNGLKPLVDEVVEAVLVIANEITIFYNKVLAPIIDWVIEKILPPIVKVIDGIIEAAKKIVVAITNIVKGIVEAIKGIIQFIVGVFTGDWEKAWNGIKNFFSGIGTAFKGIIDAMTAVFQGICDFVKNVVVGAFQIAWETIKKVWEQVVGFFQAVWDGIKEVFNKVKEWFKEKFDAAWEGIKTAWSGVKTWFSDVWTGIKNTFSSVGTWFKNIFTTAWTNIKNVFSGWSNFFSGLWNKIKSTFSSLGTSIANAISGAVKKGINGVITMIENTINSAINIINGAINLINKIPGVTVNKVSKLTLPKLARGGVVDSPTVAMIGEQGKEAVVPLENNTEWMDKLAERLTARSTPSKIVLMLNEKVLGEATVNSINNITMQSGVMPLVIA